MIELAMGILGTARISQSIIPAVCEIDNIEISAIASRTRSKAKAFAKHWNIPRYYGCYNELLDDSTIDVVYIPLPNSLHAEWTVRAARSGKHVLCEKPLCLSVDEAENITKTAKEFDVIVVEALMYRHGELALTTKTLVDNDEIGSIQTIDSSFCYPTERPDDDIRFKKELGGGALWDLGYYPISLSNYLVGTMPIKVTGKEDSRGGIDHTVFGRLQYSNGVVANVASSFDLPRDSSLRITGTKGEIVLSNSFLRADKNYIVIKRNGHQEKLLIESQGHRYAGQIRDLCEAIVTGQEPEVTLAESANNVATVCALLRSLKEDANLN